MARYEKPDDESGKYWEITLKGLVVSTKSGKIGLGPSSEWQGRTHFSERRGRRTDREYPDLATAQREHDKLVAAKLKEGFKRVDGAPPPLVVEVLSNADLEAAILATPNDLEPYSIYADWLQSKGDPRGELIAMQIGMRNHTDAAKFMTFKKQDEYLRKTYGHLWLGDVAEYRVKLVWKHGFVDTARILLEAHPGEAPIGALVGALVTSVCGRLVREIALRGITPSLLVRDLPALPPSLQRLVFEVPPPFLAEMTKARDALALGVAVDVVTYARSVDDLLR